MRVISILVKSDSIVFNSEKIKIDKFSCVNTNKFYDNKTYYTRQYIKSHKNKIIDLLSSVSVDKVVYNNYDSFLLLSSFINYSHIVFNVKKALPLKVINVLIKSKINSLECYFMPSDYVHLFSKRNVSIKFNNDSSFTPEFVFHNDLKNLKGIYYKKIINFYDEEEVKNNLESFLKVNHSLKLIYLYFYSNDSISYIVDTLNNMGLLDIDIFIYQNESVQDSLVSNVNYLRKVNKKYSKNGNREIKIIYSNEFFNNNIFKELTINGLKFAMVVIIYVSVIMIFYNEYHEYVALINLRKLENSLNEEVSFIDSIDEINDAEVNEPVIQNTDDTEETSKIYVNQYANIPVTFDKLLSINSDVKGWLSVNNTKINYPVTQYSDNSFYLHHDIYSKEIMTGWVFMDYRNNAVDLDQNTIIYGHNLLSGYMFGELYKTTYSGWYTNPYNQIITFNTVDTNMKWKIFSIYKTDYTTDYLTTNFYNDENFMNFISMLKDRSIYNFNVDINSNDKILTLSTCSGSNNRRLVVHAVLIDK